MNIIDLLLRLYPAQWRDRYGEEFRALLEQCDLTIGDKFDILWGALDARIYGLPEKGRRMKQRIVGIFSLGVAGVMLLALRDALVFQSVTLVLFGLVPIGLVLLMGLIHMLLVKAAPITAYTALTLGLLSAVILLISYPLTNFWIMRFGDATIHHFAALVYGIIGLMGVWLMAVNSLLIRFGLCPAPLGAVGVIAGLFWWLIFWFEGLVWSLGLRTGAVVLFDKTPVLIPIVCMTMAIWAAGMGWLVFTGRLGSSSRYRLAQS